MPIRKTIKSIQEFIQLESVSGLLLITFAILALIVANSPWQSIYNTMVSMPLALDLGLFTITDTLVEWINEGLMALFFLLVGLEIKRETLEGELNTWKKIALPAFAALGGMVVPALIYLYFNFHNADAMHGWAIPVATDIAFSLGILSIFNGRIPISLKVLLTALAILDDLGAIIIIALFYTGYLSYLSLALAGICLILLASLNRLGVIKRWPYFIVGFFLWICVMKSGVHATLAGVALALAIPLRNGNYPEVSPLRDLEEKLHPWIAYLVLPIFAFFNAGVSLKGIQLSTFFETVPLGIILGLFLGKQIGVMGSAFLAVKLKLASLPKDVDWLWMYGLALICGIGFTMSLFIGTLAFGLTDLHYAMTMRLGVLTGSLFSAILGGIILVLMSKRQALQ